MPVGRYVTVDSGQLQLDNVVRRLFALSGCGPFEGFASGAYNESTYVNGAFLQESIWWESNAKLKRIVDLLITRNNNKLPVTVRWRSYEDDGVTVLNTFTDTITYNGVVETSRTRVIT